MNISIVKIMYINEHIDRKKKTMIRKDLNMAIVYNYYQADEILQQLS